jgi:hypothetical protein
LDFELYHMSLDDDNYLEWDPKYNLSPSDFRKEFDDKKSVIPGQMGRTAVSFLAYVPSFQLEFTKDFKKFSFRNFKLITIFVRNNSFFDLQKAKDENRTSKEIDFLILHEQGHFDLAEYLRPRLETYCSSLCKGRLFETTGSTQNEIEFFARNHTNYYLEPILKKIHENMKQEQMIYEKHTDHGRIEKNQLEYNQKWANFRKEQISKKI